MTLTDQDLDQSGSPNNTAMEIPISTYDEANNGRLRALDTGRFTQTISDIHWAKFTMTLTDHDLDQDDDNAMEIGNTAFDPIQQTHNHIDPAGGQLTFEHSQFTTNVLSTVADFNLASKEFFQTFIQAGNEMENDPLRADLVYDGFSIRYDPDRARQITGTTVHGLSTDAGSKIDTAAIMEQGPPNTGFTPINAGSKNRGTFNGGGTHLDTSTTGGPATGVTPGRKTRKTRKTGQTGEKIDHPANKYGFHTLASKGKLQNGDNMRIPLTHGANPTLPNADFVLMEYLGRSQTKNATNWSLKTSPPVNCTAIGPKAFMKILDDNGIRGYDKIKFSNTAEMLRNGQSLGSITELKEQAIRG